MCGPQSPRPLQPLGGALAVLSSPTSQLPFSGHLVFHTVPGVPVASSMATHATFTPTDAASLEGCMIGIHASGDLRVLDRSNAMLHRFDFSRARPSLAWGRSTEILLKEPLEIGVGGQGIIGRKISVWRDVGDGDGIRIAEGIVGFN